MLSLQDNMAYIALSSAFISSHNQLQQPNKLLKIKLKGQTHLITATKILSIPKMLSKEISSLTSVYMPG